MVSHLIKITHCDPCVVLLGRESAASHQDVPFMINGEGYESDLCDMHWSLLVKPLQDFLRTHGREPERPRRNRPVIEQKRGPRTTNLRVSETEEDRTCWECGFDAGGKPIYLGPTVAALVGHLRPHHDMTLNQMREAHGLPIRNVAGPRPFRCPGCARAFGTFERLHNHAGSDHGLNLVQDAEGNIVAVDQDELPTDDHLAENRLRSEAWQAFVGRPDESVIEAGALGEMVEEPEPVGAQNE